MFRMRQAAGHQSWIATLVLAALAPSHANACSHVAFRIVRARSNDLPFLRPIAVGDIHRPRGSGPPIVEAPEDYASVARELGIRVRRRARLRQTQSKDANELLLQAWMRCRDSKLAMTMLPTTTATTVRKGKEAIVIDGPFRRNERASTLARMMDAHPARPSSLVRDGRSPLE